MHVGDRARPAGTVTEQPRSPRPSRVRHPGDADYPRCGDRFAEIAAAVSPVGSASVGGADSHKLPLRGVSYRGGGGWCHCGQTPRPRDTGGVTKFPFDQTARASERQHSLQWPPRDVDASRSPELHLYAISDVGAGPEQRSHGSGPPVRGPNGWRVSGSQALCRVIGVCKKVVGFGNYDAGHALWKARSGA